MNLITGIPIRGTIEVLEPCDGKLSRTVLRGEGSRKAHDLPGAFNPSYFKVRNFFKNMELDTLRVSSYFIPKEQLNFFQPHEKILA